MISQLENRLARQTYFAPTVLRMALGAIFVAHAYAKAFVFTFAGSEGFFAAHGFPGWTVYPVFAAEFVGGMALIAGFRTRTAALALVPVMLGALVPHASNGWMFSNQGGGWEYVAFLLVALLVQALLGGGAYALDGAKGIQTVKSDRVMGSFAANTGVPAPHSADQSSRSAQTQV